MSKKTGKKAAEPTFVKPGREGETIFGVVHIFAGDNNTFVHFTDLTGRETFSRQSGGFINEKDKKSLYRGQQVMTEAVEGAKARGINAVHIKVRAVGGTGSRQFGRACSTTMRTLARSGLKLGRIEDVTPIPTDSTRRKGGRRGRRL